ncbi:MAG TPA: right-handed parallel beta-helix repeat-containing protein, partial [bacterium]|nr:right-handed parallel beta-helix repeat-containing protein [bacterium]
MTLHRIPLALVAAALALASSSIAHATIWFVAADGSGDAPTIQAAVDSAGPNDIIELGDGIFTGDGNRDINVSKPLVFRSQSGSASACVIDCEGSIQDNHRGFSIGQDCEFRAFTIENGQANRGGAIYAGESVAAQIYDCVFVNNAAGSGGALGFDSLDIPKTFLPQAHIEGCTFLGNTALESGAVYFLAIIIDFVNCSFFGNIAEKNGGVTTFVNATPSFVNCLFANNRATAGGVIQCSDPVTFEGCTFFRNAALFGSHIDCVKIDGATTLSN